MSENDRAKGGAVFRLEKDAHGLPRAVPTEETYLERAGAGMPQAAEEPAPIGEQLPSSGTGRQWWVAKETRPMSGDTPAWEALTEDQKSLWYEGWQEHEEPCAAAFRIVAGRVAAAFPGCHLLFSPAITGLTLIEHTLPWGRKEREPYRYYGMPEELARLVAGNTTQHRMEFCGLPGLNMRSYYVYDARTAYAAYLRHLPIITADGVRHDSEPVYERYQPGKYLVDVTVPAGWAHVGLVLCKRAPGIGWMYPATPGDTFTSWLDETEIRLLDDFSWPYAVRERILFAPGKTPGSDPCKEFSERMRELLEAVEQEERTPIQRIVRAMLRACVLHPIGVMHRGSRLENVELEEGYSVPLSEAPLTPYEARWRHVEISSAVYARERVTVTRKALELPRSAVFAFRGDGLHLADYDPGWQDTGKVGCYRKQLEAHFTTARKTPGKLSELMTLRRELERAEGEDVYGN